MADLKFTLSGGLFHPKNLTVKKSIETLATYISQGHNFRGNQGKPPGTHPILKQESVECITGKGIVGDRYFGFKEDYKAQVTFFDQAIHEEVCRKFGMDTSPREYRRNVLLSGVDLNTLIGKRFAIGGVVFEGTEECTPCHWLNDVVGPGVKDFLKGRGGLRAKIVTGGAFKIGLGVMEVFEDKT